MPLALCESCSLPVVSFLQGWFFALFFGFLCFLPLLYFFTLSYCYLFFILFDSGEKESWLANYTDYIDRARLAAVVDVGVRRIDAEVVGAGAIVGRRRPIDAGPACSGKQGAT